MSEVHIKPEYADEAQLVKYRVDQMAAQPWPEVDEGREFKSDADRAWSKFDLGDCDHRRSSGVEVAGWALDVCVRCGAVVGKVECLHPATQWNEDGTMLRCATCGVDGT